MNYKILGLGEVLWDLLPTGPALGGAPANFAWHARTLGATAGVITRVGLDAWGAEIQKRCAAVAFPPELVQVDPAAPTGTVSVRMSSAGVPDYTIHEGVAWDFLAATPAARAAVGAADAVGFGSLAQRTPAARAAVQSLLAATSPAALRVFDLNLRQHYYDRDTLLASLERANVLKLNEAELPILVELLGLPGETRSALSALAAAFPLRLLALTRGPAGSLLWRAGEWSDHPGAAVRVVDTVGAGDAFTAALVLGELQGRSLAELNSLANTVARAVCAQAGATPPLPAELVRQFAG